MAGRPRLRLGEWGHITRTQLPDGRWVVRCRYRGLDGVTRKVEHRGPMKKDKKGKNEADRYGKAAEDELVAKLKAKGGAPIDTGTTVITLVEKHIDKLAQAEKAERTIDSYRYDAGRLKPFIAGVLVSEATPPWLNAVLQAVKLKHGAVTAKRCKTLLKGGMQIAVMGGLVSTNPVRDVDSVTGKKGGGAKALSDDQLHHLLATLRASDECEAKDLTDPITVFAGTGLRRNELLGLRWKDFDPKAGTVTVAGKIVRLKGQGLKWVPEAKSEAGLRTISVPKFVIDTLKARKKKPYIGQQAMIFPSTAATWRDPDNFNSQWRTVRDKLGLPEITSNSFRKTTATVIDDAGLSARIGADHLGHAKPSMTMDNYMARNRVHPAVADALDAAISGE